MDPTIAAHHHVDGGQPVLREIGTDELYAGTAVRLAVLGNHAGDDVRTDILNPAEIDLAHPIPVPTRRIQEPGDLIPAEELGKIGPDICRGAKFRADSRAALRASPGMSRISYLEEAVFGKRERNQFMNAANAQRSICQSL